MDGSLIACGFGPCVTIWRPDDLTLKCSLTHIGPQTDVKKVLFGCVGMGHLVIILKHVYYGNSRYNIFYYLSLFPAILHL